MNLMMLCVRRATQSQEAWQFIHSEASAFGDVSMRMEILAMGIKVVDLVAFGKKFQNVF